MNIKDVQNIEANKIPEVIWGPIFVKQMGLALKYQEIEKMGDLFSTLPNNINTGKGQKWIKDFAWRVTEELAEAKEAYDIMTDNADVILHFKEELIDALHFLAELTIIAGYNAHFVVNSLAADVTTITPHTDYNIHMNDVVYQMGMFCNCLKNKPWKQTEMLTDRVKFEHHLVETWIAMVTLLHQHVGKDAEIYNIYFKKNEVNKFRQKSKY